MMSARQTLRRADLAPPLRTVRRATDGRPNPGAGPAATVASVHPDAVAAALRSAGCVFAEEEAALLVAEAAGSDRLAELVARRTAGEPLEQVLGHATFAGLRIGLAPGVFVPRRRTEYLVDLACRYAPPRRPLTVVDLCCGSGALGLAIAARLRDVVLHATDSDPAAVACARRNLRSIGTTYEGDLDDPLPRALRGAVDLLVANVPYVPTADLALLPAEARLYESRTALDGGPDGLQMVRRFAAAAPAWLAPGGRALVETSDRQAHLSPDHHSTVIVSDPTSDRHAKPADIPK
jgi:release factor glutamine methyltransferase